MGVVCVGDKNLWILKWGRAHVFQRVVCKLPHMDFPATLLSSVVPYTMYHIIWHSIL